MRCERQVEAGGISGQKVRKRIHISQVDGNSGWEARLVLGQFVFRCSYFAFYLVHNFLHTRPLQYREF